MLCLWLLWCLLPLGVAICLAMIRNSGTWQPADKQRIGKHRIKSKPFSVQSLRQQNGINTPQTTGKNNQHHSQEEEENPYGALPPTNSLTSSSKESDYVALPILSFGVAGGSGTNSHGRAARESDYYALPPPVMTSSSESHYAPLPFPSQPRHSWKYSYAPKPSQRPQVGRSLSSKPSSAQKPKPTPINQSHSTG